MDVQKRIKDLMELRGWTDYRLAKEAGLSHSTVTNMFNRSNAPTLPTLDAGRLALRCLSSLRILKTMRHCRNRGCYFQSGAPLPKSSEKSCLTLWIS